MNRLYILETGIKLLKVTYTAFFWVFLPVSLAEVLWAETTVMGGGHYHHPLKPC